MGLTAAEGDGQAFRGGLGQAAAVDHRPLRVAAQIVEGVDFADALFPEQLRTSPGALANLLRRLEDEIHGAGKGQLVQLQRQTAQRGAVTIVAALVGDAGAEGAMGQGDALVDGQSVRVRPEGNGGFGGGGCLLHRVKPAIPVHDGQGGVLPQKGLEPRHGALLPAGQLRMSVQLVAQSGDFCQIDLIHVANPPLLMWDHSTPPGGHCQSARGGRGYYQIVSVLSDFFLAFS